MAPGAKKNSASKNKGSKKSLSSKSKGQQQELEVQVGSLLKYHLDQCLRTEEPNIQAFWGALTEKHRQELLTLDIKQLREAALERTQEINTSSVRSLEHATLLSQGRSLVEVLEQGIKRLNGKPAHYGWKVWRWPNVDKEFLDAASFRRYVASSHIDQDLIKFMPEGEATKAEADALQKRMMELYQQVQFSEEDLMARELTGDDQLGPVELITILLAGLEREHFYLYFFMLLPVINAVTKALPKSKRATTATTLSYCDLEKVPQYVLLNICDWLHIGVIMLGRFRGEGFGKDWLLPADRASVTLQPWECDKFCLSPHDKGQMQLDSLWYDYLQVHTRDNMCKCCEEESAKEPKPLGSSGVDYVLQWVLGVKCDPETLRGWNQSTIGTWVPTVQYAYSQLLHALRDFKAWQLRAEESKQLLHDMLVCRRNLAEHRTKYDLSSKTDRKDNMHPCELPDHVVAALLEREALLNKVRVHTVKIQQILDRERLRSLQTKQLQGEPKFERWEALLRATCTLQDQSSGKKQPRKPLGHSVLDHSGILEKFESLGATLRAYEAEEKAVAMKIEYHSEEIERCDEWALNITRMASSLGELADARANPLGASLQEGCICPCCNSSTCPTLAASRQVANTMQKQQAEEVRETAEMLKQAFQTDVRYQLLDDADDQRLYQVAQKQLKLIAKRQQEGQAVLPLLEAYMVNLACDDPCTVLGPQLMLPMLRKRLTASAHMFGREKALHDQLQKAVEQETAALRASQDLIAEEERQQAHAAAKKAKKERAKAKKQQSQQCPLPKPDTPMDSPGAIAVTAALQNGTDLSTASITSGVPTQPVASANTSLDVDPNSIKSATTCMGFSDQAEWRGGGRKDSVMPVQPTKIAGSHLVEPALTTKSSSMSPFMLEQRVLHLMLCPITQAVMDDPVIAADGHTYEKAAMQKWLQQHSTSPVTGETLTHGRLVPNIVIRSVIQQQLL